MSRQTTVSILVGVSLFIAYTLYYSGTIHAFDQEEGMLLVTDSLVRKGWFDVDQHLNITDATISLLAERVGPDGHNYLKFGLPTSLAAVPLYLIGLAVPGLGAVQTAFALNALITAITGALLVATVIRLGYDLSVAAASGLVFGLLTMAGVYGRFFGSEPLVGLALLLALWGLLRFRQRRHWLAAAWVGFALGLAVATRPATAVVLPFFVWMFFGYWRLEIRDWRFRNLRSPISFFVAAGLWFTLILVYNHVRFGSVLESGYGSNESFTTPLLTGLYGLLFSPGKSLFLYSPVLILGAGGALLLWRRERALTNFILTISFVYVGLYATWNGWWGGVYWGPRHAAPLIPLFVLLVAPMIDLARIHRRAGMLVITFIALSLVPQILGGLMDFEAYEVRINQWAARATFAMIYWPSLSPLLAHLREFQINDVAWAAPMVDWWYLPMVFAGLGFTFWAIWRTARNADLRPGRLLLSGIGIAILLWGVLLVRAKQRAPYGPLDGPRAALQTIDTNAQEGDVLISRTGERSLVIMNHMQARMPWYTFDARAELPANEVDAHLARVTVNAHRVWLLTPEPRDLSNQTSLHIEAWLSARAFPVSDEVFGPAARLILYDLPEETHRHESADVNFGENILLKRSWYQAADNTLLVELDWQALNTPATNYSISLQLINSAGQLVGQLDRWPVNGFSPTALWQAGDLIADRYALPLGALPPGEFDIRLAVYDSVTLDRLPVTSDSGNSYSLGALVVSNSID